MAKIIIFYGKYLPTRCHQSFDKTNEKIKEFVKNKIAKWVSDEEEAERLRKELILKREHREKNELSKLIDSF